MLGSSSIAKVQGSILIFMQSQPFDPSLEKALLSNGYQVTFVTTEAAAFAAVKESAPSLIIVERREGIATALRQLRAAAVAPIVAIANEVKGCLDEECLQDYDSEVDLVLCNQTPRQVVARVRAILRRCTPAADRADRHYRAGNIQLDLDRHEVIVGGQTIMLTPKEFRILHQFIEAPGRVFSRQEMLNRVWGEGYALEEHALDVHIHSLRQKIEIDPTEPSLIMTVRGIGYKLCV